MSHQTKRAADKRKDLLAGLGFTVAFAAGVAVGRGGADTPAWMACIAVAGFALGWFGSNAIMFVIDNREGK